MTAIALAIPHTDWVPARAASMARLRAQLGQVDGPYREFTDRAPNHVWSVALWTWLYESGAEWGLQLQDDVMVAPCFWPALRASLSALPPAAEVVGLTSLHPSSREIARRGHRWYRTDANLVGWAYAVRHDALGAFLRDRERMGESFRQQNEDEQLGLWAGQTKRTVWHPVPTLCDHDTSIPSTYANDFHSHRRPQVTWREFGEASLTDPTWWTPSGVPEKLAAPMQRVCWWCAEHQAVARSATTGAEICGMCLGMILGSQIHGGRQ